MTMHDMMRSRGSNAFLMSKIRVAAVALLALHAGGCFLSPNSAGGGRSVNRDAELYQPDVEEGDQSLQGVVVYLSVSKEHPMSPIQHDLEILKKALSAEITARGGSVVEQPSAHALRLQVSVSRYNTVYLSAMPAASRHRTFLDFSCRIDHAEGRHLPPQGVRSISGSGMSPILAHRAALVRFVGINLCEPRITAFLAEHRVSSEGLLALRLETLAADFFAKARTNPMLQNAALPVKLALAPLREDANNRIGAQLLPALMKQFSPPDYRFSTRTQLESILQEQALQMSDLVDQRTTAAAGGLQGVDYLVTGSLDPQSSGLAIQVELVSVGTGEVLASAAVLVRN